jgi:Flp pilus assembly protein TadD
MRQHTFFLGNVYAKANIFAKAIEEYNKTLKLEPLRFYDVFHSLGYIYFKKGLIDEAIKVYKIAASRPGLYRAMIYNGLATAYNKKGQYKEAIEAGLSALKYNPYLNSTHYNLALSYSGMGFIDKAINEYEEYLKVNPEYYGVRVDAGYLYYKKGDYLNARRHWLKALEIAKDYKPAKDALGLLKN